MPAMEPVANPVSGDPFARSEAEWPLNLRERLLDPEAWQDILEKYARTTRLAVALTDTGGRLLGACINPRPTWSLLHGPPSPDGPCPFALRPTHPCTCVAEALVYSNFRLSRDRPGLVHFAVPLLLNEHRLGALIAGQVFDAYPEQMMLELCAKEFGVRMDEVWRRARLEAPIKPATLRIYADLLATFGQNFLRRRYDMLVEGNRLAEMTQLRDQLQQRTRELMEADQRKDEFLAMLAHELRNPLAPIRNSVQVMTRLLSEDDGDLRWSAGVVERQTQHLTRLVDDLLDVSRFTHGRIELRKEPTDLAAVVAGVLETTRPAIDERRQHLSVALPSEPLLLEADPVRMAQVVANLLNNAVKYTPEGGQIWLSLERLDGEAVLRVRDAGIGISADLLPRVFDLFTQAEHTLDRSRGGLGIGLTLVRGLVEQHGGRVEVASGGANQGSEFVVRLPLSSQPLRPKIIPTANPALASSLSRRVLVVDDNADAANSLAKLLELTGHEARTAYDGPSALEAARAYRPDLILLDIGLPNLDGYEVARRLRKQPDNERTLIVALTGYGQDADQRRSRAVGFDCHLVKPVDFDMIQLLLTSLRSPARAPS